MEANYVSTNYVQQNKHVECCVTTTFTPDICVIPVIFYYPLKLPPSKPTSAATTSTKAAAAPKTTREATPTEASAKPAPKSAESPSEAAAVATVAAVQNLVHHHARNKRASPARTGTTTALAVLVVADVVFRVVQGVLCSLGGCLSINHSSTSITRALILRGSKASLRLGKLGACRLSDNPPARGNQVFSSGNTGLRRGHGVVQDLQASFLAGGGFTHVI